MIPDRTLPPTWSWARFGEVATVSSNLVDPARYQSLPHIAPNHIESRTGRLLPFNTVAEDGVTSPKHLFQQGQILYSKIRPYLAKAAEVSFDGLCSADMYPIDTILLPRFLLHWLVSSEFTQFASHLQGRTVLPKINRAQLDSLPVPVAPLREQSRIVAAIEEQFSKLDAGVVALARIRQKLRRIRSSVLEAAVTGCLVSYTDEDVQATLDLVSFERRQAWRTVSNRAYREPSRAARFSFPLPAHWRVASLEEITDPIRVICYGILMPKEDVANGVPYVRVKDMKAWSIDVGGLKRTSQVIAAKHARSSLQVGDILLAIRGSYGRVAIVPPELSGANITQDSARIASHPLVDSRYLLYYLGGPVANHFYGQVARGVAVKGVNIGDLRAMPVPIPPRKEQEAIAAEVERQFAVLQSLEAMVDLQVRRGQSLRSSILDRAFSGELVPQDLEDEPASMLLRRMAADRALANGHRVRRGNGLTVARSEALA